MDDDRCIICNESLFNGLQIKLVSEKGLQSFIKKSQEKQDNKWTFWINKPKVSFHEKCRCRYLVSSSKPSTAEQIVDVTPCRTSSNLEENILKKRRLVFPEHSISDDHDSFSESAEYLCASSEVSSSTPNNNDSISSSETHSHLLCGTSSNSGIDKLSSELEASMPSNPNAIYNFNFSELCVICGCFLYRYRHRVQCIQSQDTFSALVERSHDDRSSTILDRLASASSRNIEAFYHKKCYGEIYHAVPKHETLSQNVDTTEEESFEEQFEIVCHYIEQSTQFNHTLTELEKGIDQKILDREKLVRKLQEKYGEYVQIIRQQGRSPMVIYKPFNISDISDELLHDEKSLDEHKKNFILSLAAQILRTDITQGSFESDAYPPANKFLDNVKSDIPNSLKTFLTDLLIRRDINGTENTVSDVKLDSIAHSIMTIIRPKTFISKLQLAVGTYVYRKTGSRLIVDLLSKMGVSTSYYNIQLFEASVIMDPPEMEVGNAVVQYVFDNTDHNVSTLKGHDTFHCLGGIGVYTPAHEIEFIGGSKKLKKMPAASTLAIQKRIETLPLKESKSNGLQYIYYMETDILDLGNKPVLEPSYAAYIWSKAFGLEKLPSWKGFFEILTREKSYDTSQIICLPFINEPPSNMTTLNTALRYASNESRKLNQSTVFVTFDQPLYLKARSIVAQPENKDLNNVVVRLGGFHLLMSYLGAIGYIMDGSGLEDLWSTVYAPESVKRMLTGHAFARAVRCHILTFTAISIVICRSIHASAASKTSIEHFFRHWATEPPQTGDCNAEPAVVQLMNIFLQEIKLLKENGPTAKLWIQYLESVVIALQFIEAERSGNFQLMMQCIRSMLPIFHAAGHFAYAKSAQIYLQDLANLQDKMKNEEEYRNFTDGGYFTIRRSDKAWSGIWSDMTIEQTLNRFFGNDLKHGRGVTPGVLARYLLAMPTAFHVMECLENYCGIKSDTSEQHVDLSRSRIKQDRNDTDSFVFWLDEHKPFKRRSSIMSLSTGVMGGPIVNCYMAFKIGRIGMASMVGKSVDEVSLSTVNKVIPISAVSNGVHLRDEHFISVDSNLLFQRIAAQFQGDENKTRDALKYELSPFPLSLYGRDGLMRSPKKSELYKLFKTHPYSNTLTESFKYVVDGGWLLHKIVWPHSKTFKDIFEIYKLYILRNFNDDPIIVFDGYNKEIIGVKSYERYRRKQKTVAADVKIEENHLITVNQRKFFSNTANKFKFVSLLESYLKRHRIRTKIASEDADTLIVNTALEEREERENTMSESKSVAIVGNDVDLLILAIGLTPDTDLLYFDKRAAGKTGNGIYSTENHKKSKPFILFAHAFAGCDSTSAIFNKGKKSIISILQANETLQKLVSIFYDKDKMVDELYEVSAKFIIHLYDPDKYRAVSINDLRYSIFISSVSNVRKKFDLANLPPTESALREHTKRVYYQIQLWKGNSLNPEEWGWKRTPVMLIPTMTDEPAAPMQLLEKVFCSCQKDCTSARCTCKKAGLSCTKMCRNCNGESCDNIDHIRNRTDEEDTDALQSNTGFCDLNTQDNDSYNYNCELSQSTDHPVRQMNISPDFDERVSDESGQSMDVDNNDCIYRFE